MAALDRVVAVNRARPRWTRPVDGASTFTAGGSCPGDSVVRPRVALLRCIAVQHRRDRRACVRVGLNAQSVRVLRGKTQQGAER
jgi:hypothetical protein